MASIHDAKHHILMAIIQFGVDMDAMGNKELCQYMNHGIMSMTDFMDELIMELIRYSYDKNAEKYSIRNHLIQNGWVDKNGHIYDDKKAAFGRSREYAQKYRDLEAKRRVEHYGEMVDEIKELLPPSMDDMQDKLSGYKFNRMQFFELKQLQELRICKSFVEHRLEDNNSVNNKTFKEIFLQYEEFVDSLRLTEDMSDEDVVFNSLAYWVLQWKYPLELFYTVAEYVDNNKDIQLNKTQLALMCADLHVSLAQGTASSASRFVKIRNKFVPKLLYGESGMNLEIEFDSFTLQNYIYLKAIMIQRYAADVEKGIMLKDWFADNVSMNEIATFLRGYNVFAAHRSKEWNNKRIRTVRELIKMLTIK